MLEQITGQEHAAETRERWDDAAIKCSRAVAVELLAEALEDTRRVAAESRETLEDDSSSSVRLRCHFRGIENVCCGLARRLAEVARQQEGVNR